MYAFTVGIMAVVHLLVCRQFVVMFTLLFDMLTPIWLLCCCVPQATQISPWIVTLDALQPFKCEAQPQDPEVLPYLKETGRHTYDIHLSVDLIPAGSSTATTVTRSNLKYM
eukprot:jgi/Chrzof1/9928/Cz04g21020.t1